MSLSLSSAPPGGAGAYCPRRCAAAAVPRAEGQRPPQAAQPPEPRGARQRRPLPRRSRDPHAALRAAGRGEHAAQHGASAKRSSATSSTRCSASARSSRCCATRRSATSWSTPTRTSTSSATASSRSMPTTFQDDKHLLRVIDRIVSGVGRRVDDSSPMVDARLPDGSRVNAIIPPLAVDGPLLSIRRFPAERLKAEDLVTLRAMTRPMLEFLEHCVRAQLNMLISGGTGAGKTTLLNVLSSFISERERIVTIEDAAELQLHQEHVVAARDAAAQRRRQGRGPAAAAADQRPAYASRPHRRRRGPRRGSARHAAGDEHRPRRLADHRARQHAARRAVAYRDDDRDGRDQPAGARDAPADRRRRSRSSSSSRA